MPIYRIPERILYVDACDFAGAGILLGSTNQVAHYMLRVDDRIMSSTWREMKALEFKIEIFSDQLYYRFVKIYSDNQNAIRIVNQDSHVSIGIRTKIIRISLNMALL
jgi:hypothetical protein